MTQWYVLRVRQEIDARDRLADLGFYAYVPQERVQRRLGRRLRPVERPVWRGYVFVICQPEDLCIVGALGDFVCYIAEQEVAGVVFTVSTPVQLAIGALDPILAAEVEGELDYVPVEYRAQQGDRVRVKSGKWKGFLGRVISVGKRKASMSIEKGIGRMEVDLDALEPMVETEAKAA